MMRLLFIFMLLLFCAGTAQAKPILDIQEVKSPGGITAWLVEDHSVPVIALQFAFRGAGAINDPDDKQGLAQILSNTMDEGAGDLTSEVFQKELRDLSIDLSFNSTRDDFSGSVKTLTVNKTRAFELIKLALNAPRFDADPVARMIASNRSRILESLNDPDWIAARLMNDVAFEGHPYARNSGGTLSSLEKITPYDLREFHKTWLAKSNLVVAVAGDIKKEELASVLDKIFSALPADAPAVKRPLFTLKNEGQTAIFKKDVPQSVIEIMQPGIDRADPDYHTAQVMNFILGSSGFGSRLTEIIREKRGLTYGIYSSLLDMNYFDGLSVSTSTDNKNVPEMLSLIKTEWDIMKTTKISDKELQDAKSYLIGALPLSLTSTDDIAGLLLALQTDNLPLNYLDLREQAIRKTTADDVQKLAQTLLNTNKMTAVIVGAPPGIKGAVFKDKIPNAE
ncbi:MAG: M16 family metallopeptidase [Alphaproteobacteria bacterium]